MTSTIRRDASRRSLGPQLRLRLTTLAAGLLLATAAAAQSGPIPVDLPAQPLDKALQALARQGGVQIVFVTELTAGKQAAALKGRLTVREALDRLVAGSGLVVSARDERTFTVERPASALPVATLPKVVTTARAEPLPAPYAGGQVASGGQVGLLGELDVMDTPFNVTRYTSELIENQQSRTLMDVLDNDPSVRASGHRDGEADMVMVRGFALYGREIMVNGMYGLVDTRGQTLEAVERVEIQKGPSAMLNGVSPWGSSAGGSVNYVLKRATDDPLTRVTATFASESQFGGHLDIGRRFGEKKQFGVRLNTSYRDGETDISRTNNRVGMAALALDYRGEKLRLTGDFGHQDRMLRGGLGSTRIGSTVKIPDAPDASVSSKQAWEFFDGQNTYGTLRAEYDVADRWTVGAAYGRNTSDEVYLLTIDSINNVNGNKTGTPYWIPARSTNESAEISVKGRFETGPVAHSLSMIASKNDGKRGQLNWSVPGCGSNCVPSNIYDPIYYPAPDTSTLNTNGIKLTSQLEYSGIALADVMRLWDGRVLLMAGARQQEVGSKNFNYDTGAVTSQYSRKKLSPSAGIVFKARPDVALYASYIESLNPGGTVSTYYANGGEIFQPYVTEQYEAGVKVDLGRFTATASLFQVAVPSAVEVAATVTGGKPTLTQDGNERHRGLELNVFGEPAHGVRLLGGLMLLDAKMVKTDNGVNDGKRARGAPRQNVNLGAEWDTPAVPGLTLSGRVLYTSSEYLDLTNTADRSIPAWTRVDAGARYSFTAGATPVMLRLSIDNLFNRDYWAAASRGVLTLGAPRSVRLSASVDF